MRKMITLLAGMALTVLLAGTASAQNLQGRFAVTGRLGAIIPADSTANSPAGRLVVETDAGFIGGGGLLFGVSDEVAMEMDVTYATFGTSEWGDVEMTTVSLGGQYRIRERNSVVPYLGGGIDVLIPDLPGHAVDTVVGLHLAGGLDFLLDRQIALNLEVKGVEAFEADVRGFNGSHVGDLDPTNLSVTVGARFFFN